MAACFPPADVSWLAFAAFAPLLWALDGVASDGRPGSARGLRAAALGVAAGFTTTLWGFGFLVEVLAGAGGLPRAAAWAALVGLSLWSGLGVGLASAIAARVAASGLPVGLAFAILYALHERLWPALLPWSFGAVWLDHGPVAQCAAYVGAAGLTALAILPAAAFVSLSSAPRARASRALVAGSIVLLLGAAWAGETRSAGLTHFAERRTRLSVGLVHLEPPREAARLAALLDTTRALERQGAELVVWSEGAIPGLVPSGELDARFGRGLPGVRVPTWVGLVLVDEDGRRSNTALLVSPGGVEARQDKRSLLPFAERTPNWVPLAWLGLPRRDFAPGERAEAAHVGGATMAATVCYEDTLSGGLRWLVDQTRAELLVNLTNDGWFAHDPYVAERHLLLARLGAIELGRDMVRATDAGVTAWIDATGSVRARAPRSAEGALLTRPTLRDERTFHTWAGEAPLVLLAAGLLLVSEGLRRRRLGAAPGAPSSLSPSAPS